MAMTPAEAERPADSQDEPTTGLRVGIVGLGLGRYYAEQTGASPLVGEIRVCDPDNARLTDAVSDIPKIASAHTTVESLLSAGTLDAVYVFTPDHLHRQHVELALEAGADVLVTKPIALSLDDARSMIHTAERLSRQLMVAHEARLRTQARAIADVVHSGELGEPVFFRLDSFFDKREQFGRAPWYAAPESGRTAMVGTGIHEVDLLRHLSGLEIESVSATGNALGDLYFPDRETTVAATFRFRGGAIGCVTVSYVARGLPSDQLVFIGSRGSIGHGQIFREGRDAEPLPPASEWRTGFDGCVEGFLRAVQAGEPVPISARDAFASLAACVAADESARTGRLAVPAAAD